jgi:hypothetical protein
MSNNIFGCGRGDGIHLLGLWIGVDNKAIALQTYIGLITVAVAEEIRYNLLGLEM